MIEPIKPIDVISARKTFLPENVIESFNEMITKHFTGDSAKFRQAEVVELILSKMNKDCENGAVLVSAQEIYDNKWLNVEDVYESAGWKVDYDKPGYNESYGPTFEFKKNARKIL